MTNACLNTADLKQHEFLDLVRNLDPPSATRRRIWLEAADGWAFSWWLGLDQDLIWCGASRDPCAEPAESCLSRSTAGRLFAPDGELRWRVIPALGNACWRTTFLGNDDWTRAALKDCSDHLQGLTPKQLRYFLWGQQTAATSGEWIELRIPNRFCYPVDGNPRQVRAVVEQWCDESGELHFQRLSDLEPAPETADA